MTRLFAVLLGACVFGGVAAIGSTLDPKPGVDWPSFRGIRGAGIADGFTTATAWDVPKNQNVRWKVTLEGLGHASPIVWGNRVCVTTAISGKPDAGLKIGLYGDIASCPTTPSTRGNFSATTRRQANRWSITRFTPASPPSSVT